MELPVNRTMLVLCLSGIITAPLNADDFAPVGSNVTLNVEYHYASAGQQSSEGMYDPRVWKAEQMVKLTTVLSAQKPQALSSLQELEPEQLADIQAKQAKAQEMQTDMAPMMANVEEIMAKCGEDEACIEREVQKMGFGMSEDPEAMAGIQATQEGAKELFAPDAPRYQRWQAVSQVGTYSIDETLHARVTDPICMEIPGGVCTRDEVRKGGGAIPPPPEGDSATAGAASGATMEMDAGKGTLLFILPVPTAPLAYTETITTDEPEGTHDTPTPQGPQQKLMGFMGSGQGNPRALDPITVSFNGDWNNLKGEKVVDMQGTYGETAKMTIRWRFSAN